VQLLLKNFHLSESKKAASKSGLHFCCRQHKDFAQQISFNLTKMWPDHYNTGTCRAIAFKAYEKRCAGCGYDKIPEILEVHHKDRNRNNNAKENLEVLCPNCHCEEHYLTKTGKWRSRSP
jgi:5-methylcytosine-specific restriction endonuclease McrA